MECQRVHEIIFLFFDNEMDEEMLPPFRDHVARCGSCKRQVSYTEKVLVLVRERCVRKEAPQRLKARLRERFRDDGHGTLRA